MSNNQKEMKHGVLGIDYAEKRKSNKALKYRLWRRTFEVINSIEQNLQKSPGSIIDLGTAEGRMLNEIQKKYPEAKCVGIEYNQKLVDVANKLFPKLEIKQGDVLSLEDYKNSSFEVAVATAVIEHLENQEAFIKQIARILKPGGVLILTAPDPFWERIATKIGHLDDEQHSEVPNLKKLCSLAKNGGLEVITAQKFMISPIGMPAEFLAERILRFFKLNFLMANQLLVAKLL